MNKYLIRNKLIRCTASNWLQQIAFLPCSLIKHFESLSSQCYDRVIRNMENSNGRNLISLRIHKTNNFLMWEKKSCRETNWCWKIWAVGEMKKQNPRDPCDEFYGKLCKAEQTISSFPFASDESSCLQRARKILHAYLGTALLIPFWFAWGDIKQNCFGDSASISRSSERNLPQTET